MRGDFFAGGTNIGGFSPTTKGGYNHAVEHNYRGIGPYIKLFFYKQGSAFVEVSDPPVLEG